jgi:hypothetical protein
LISGVNLFRTPHFLACIALALPLHCGWDGQFKGNARGIKAGKIDEEMNQHTSKIYLATLIELETYFWLTA